MTIDTTFAISEIAGGTRFLLPKRKLPLSLLKVARAIMTLGGLLMVGGLAPIASGNIALFSWFHGLALIAGVMPLVVGLLMIRGQSTVECRGGYLVVRDQFSLIRWQRRFELMKIKQLAVAELPINVAAKGAGSGLGGESITILIADQGERGRRVLLFGYDAALLENIITQMRRRCGFHPTESDHKIVH